MTPQETTVAEDLRNELIAMVAAADLVSPEQVADLVLSAAETGGRDAAIAVLDRAKAIDRDEAARCK